MIIIIGTVDLARFLELPQPPNKQSKSSKVRKGARVLTSEENVMFLKEQEENKRLILEEKERKKKIREDQKKEREHMTAEKKKIAAEKKRIAAEKKRIATGKKTTMNKENENGNPKYNKINVLIIHTHLMMYLLAAN